LKPKKHLGQHFLRDDNISRKIVSLLPHEFSGPLVEIGPGTGALTRFLSGKYSPFLGVEFDPEAVEVLNQSFPPGDPAIYNLDILSWNPAKYLSVPGWFIGNLPYNISSPVFFHLLLNLDWVTGGVFMVQKEVAERITSPPGNKNYGILSVILGYYFEIRYRFTVSENVFIPPPKVKSAVFTMVKKPGERKIKPSEFIPLVKKAFNQRRKTLRNALKGINFSSEAEKYLSLRAEQLSTNDFEQLFFLQVKNGDE
jgi:16S rRNA (adenine1518-N6/adenine1519-N6)-dimethyltransferase